MKEEDASENVNTATYVGDPELNSKLMMNLRRKREIMGCALINTM